MTHLSLLKKENNYSNKPDCLDYCSTFRSTSDRKSEESVIKMTNRTDYRQLIRPFLSARIYSRASTSYFVKVGVHNNNNSASFNLSSKLPKFVHLG